MTSASDIISGLGGSLHTGMCRCPAHDDTTPSLHVRESRGKVLWKCHAGCSQETVRERLIALGLWKPEGHSKQNRSQMREQEWEQQQKEFERFHRARMILRAALCNGITKPNAYLKGRGITIVPDCAMLLTTEGATKLQRGKLPKFPHYPAMVLPVINAQLRLLGAHVIHLNRDGTRKLELASERSAKRSYGLIRGGFIPLSDLDPDKPTAKLIVAEGIETALSAMEICDLPGIACCGTAGLQAVDVPNCGEVIIVADNDELGLKAATALAQRLADAGRKVRIAIPENKGEDFNDVLRNQQTNLEQVKHAILNSKSVTRSAAVRSLGMEEFMSLHFPPREYILRPWLTTAGLAMLDGLPGHGKTILAMSMGYVAAGGGDDLLRWRVERPVRVLYVEGELPGDLLQTRLRELGPTLPGQQFRILALSQFEHRGEPMPDLGTEEGRALVDREIEQQQSDLIFLDSISTLVTSGEDNGVEDWRGIQAWCLHHRARGRSIVYLHHHGRSGNPRGTSMREIVLDSRIKISEHEIGEDTTSFRLEFPKHRGFHGRDTRPLIAQLSTTTGCVAWTAKQVEDSHERVRELLTRGMTQARIAKALGLSKGWVSRIIKELKMEREGAGDAAS